MSRGTRLRHGLQALTIGAAAVVLAAMPARAQVVAAPSDQPLGPTMSNVRISPSPIDTRSGPQRVEVTVHVTAVRADVGRVVIGLGNDEREISYQSQDAFTLVSGTPRSGDWRGSVSVPRYAPTADYQVTCFASDVLGVGSSGCGADIRVPVRGGDSGPPTISDVTVDHQSVDVTEIAATVTITARVRDDLSGVTFFNLDIRNRWTRSIYGGSPTRVAGDAHDGRWRQTFTIPRHAPSGSYELNCDANDAVFQRTVDCNTDIQIQVVGGDPSAPDVSDFTTSTQYVDVSTEAAAIDVSARVRGKDADVRQVSIWMDYEDDNTHGNGGASAIADLRSGSVRDGMWGATLTVSPGTPPGDYKLHCYAEDTGGRVNPDCGRHLDVWVAGPIDLAAKVGSSSPTVRPGSHVDLVAEAFNGSTGKPTDPRMQITVPHGTTATTLPSGCSLQAGGAEVRCTLDPDHLRRHETIQRTIGLDVAPATTGMISSTVSVTNAVDPDLTNDTATVAIPVEAPDDTGAPARLSLANNVSPLEALPGDTVTYTLTATNGAGAGDATGTVVTDVLPDGVTFADASEGCTNTDGTVRCELGTVAAGSSKAATIRATVDPIPMRADPNTAHQVLETKAETDLRVERAETKTATASCPTGYLATDGGIRLDAVDQGGDVAKTGVRASGPTADGSGWTATLRNDNPGAALAKVTVACLARTTVTGAHQHDLETTTASAPAQPLAAGTSTVTVACAAGQTPFAPSYALAGGGVVTTSWESGSGWTFVVDSPAAGTGEFGIACLGARTTTAAGHYHVLGIDHRAETITVPAGKTVETQLTCASEAKGIVASRRVDAGLVDRGTDPRAKIRAFRFTNPTDHALSADLGLTCVDIRTSGEPVSVRITNTATATTTAPDVTTADDKATSTFTAYGDGWAILPTTAASVAGRAQSASVGVEVRCASDCVVSARLVAVSRVRGTALRAGSTLGSGRATLAAGAGQLTLRATGTAAKALTSRKVTRAKVVITTSDGATTTKTVSLRR